MELRGGTLRLSDMRLVAVGLAAASVLLTGCTEPSEARGASDEGGNGDSSSVAPTLDAKWRGSMTVDPATAAPGQQIALRFDSEKVRGIAFSLSVWDEEGWAVAYYLTSDWGSPGDHSPDWWSVEDSEGRGWVDVGVGGPGPDHVVVPDSAPAGDYLLCTANSSDEACASLTVIG